MSSSSPWAQCLALPLRPSPDPSLSQEDRPDPSAKAPRLLVASASHRSRAPRHPRDRGKRPAQPTQPGGAAGTRDARLPGGRGEYYTTEGGPGAQIGQRDGTRGPARSFPRLPAPIAGGFAQRGRRVEKTGRDQLVPRAPRPSANGRRQLTRSAPESPSSSSGSTEPVVIVPAAPRRSGARPVPGFPRRGDAPPAPALLLPALAARAPGARPSGPAARSLRPVRPPASQPPAPLFRALGTAGEAARRPHRGPAPPARPDAGLKGAAPAPTRSAWLLAGRAASVPRDN